MLHTGILPHHTKWVRLFENLRYIVVDELHYYRGVYGSHLANISGLRSLWGMASALPYPKTKWRRRSCRLRSGSPYRQEQTNPPNPCLRHPGPV